MTLSSLHDFPASAPLAARPSAGGAATAMPHAAEEAPESISASTIAFAAAEQAPLPLAPAGRLGHPMPMPLTGYAAPAAQSKPGSALERAKAGPFFGIEAANPEANWTDGLGESLILMHSGELVQRYWRVEVKDGEAKGRYSHRVVTTSACEHLFDEVVLHPAASLRSVFTLLKSSPDLVRTFKRLDAQRILEAGLRAQDKDPTSVPVVDLSEVEFIALYRPMQRTAGGDEIQGIRVRARGVGAVQPASLFEGGYLLCRAGGRIEYDLAETPLRSLMNAPLKLDALVHIGTGAAPATGPGIDMVCTELQLGELIAAVLNELSESVGTTAA